MKKKLSAFILIFVLCFCAMFFVACNEDIIDHKIIVTSSNIRYGSVTGDGYYKTKTDVTLTATAKDEHTFICWVKDNVIISTDTEYSFVANKNTEGKYIAVFEGDNMQILKLNAIRLEYNTTDTEEDNFYELQNITLSQKIYGKDIELCNQTSSEIFQAEAEPSATEIEINNDNVYTINSNFNFTLSITIKDPRDKQQVYSNNFIITISNDSILISKAFTCSDSNLIINTIFTFSPLSSFDV